VSPTGSPNVSAAPLVYPGYSSQQTAPHVARGLSNQQVDGATQADMAGQWQVQTSLLPTYNSIQPVMENSQAYDSGIQACYSGSQAYASGSQAYDNRSQAYDRASQAYSRGTQDSGCITLMMKNAQNISRTPTFLRYPYEGEVTQRNMNGPINVHPHLRQPYSSTKPQRESSQGYETQMLNSIPQRNNDTLAMYYQSVNDTLQYKPSMHSTYNSKQPASGASREYNNGYNPQMMSNVPAGTNMNLRMLYKSVDGATRADKTISMKIQPRLQNNYSTQTQMESPQECNRKYTNRTMNNTTQRTNDDRTAYFQPVNGATSAARNDTFQYQQLAFNSGSNTNMMNNSVYWSLEDRVTSSQYVNGATRVDMERPRQYQPGPQPTYNSRQATVVDSQVQNNGYGQQMMMSNLTNTIRSDASSNQNGRLSNQTSRGASSSSTFQGFNSNY